MTEYLKPNPERFKNIGRFKELFEAISTEDSEFKEAYDAAVQLAKEKVDKKISWDPQKFKAQHANLPSDFVEALVRCIEQFNPPVNVPEERLW